MAWKDILVFGDGSLNGLARVQIAAGLAGGLPDCRLTACAPIILPQRPYGPMATGLSELVDRAHDLAREDGGRAVRAIQKAAPELIGDRLTIESPEIDLAEAQSLAGVLGQSADLVIVGRPIAEDMSRLDDLVLEGALFRSGRPCLVIPRWDKPKRIGARALIAWRGSAQAARAVHDALPLLETAQTVRIMHAGEPSPATGDNPLALARLARHLSRHGVAVEEPKSAPLGAEIGAAILAEARIMGADLLVMGAYGHGRLRDMVLGGATRTVLHHAEIAVLMAH